MKLNTMNFSRKMLFVLAGLVFIISLFLPCVDNDYGEFASGINIMGYQCLIGLILMPLVVPLATPLWLILLAGNLLAVSSPFYSPLNFIRRMKWLALLSVIGLFILTAWHQSLGLTTLHFGYFFWGASLILTCIGLWLPLDKA